jgi:arabinogalactan oligomer / maltooligosaccharide transport system substrate-binding protein
MAKNSTNKVIAHDLFADYLSQPHVMDALSAGIMAPVAHSDRLNHDPALQQFAALCDKGLPMPSFSEMNATWRALERAEVAIIEGAPARATARRAASELAEIYAYWKQPDE